MLEFKNIGLEYGDRKLFSDVTLNLFPGHRFGLVGANGTGKSSLLKMVMGEINEFDGQINLPKNVQLGYLKQDHFAFEQQRIIDVVIQGNEALWNAKQLQKQLAQAGDMNMEDAQRFAEAEEVILQHDGYAAESEAARLLDGLGIPTAQHEEVLNTLSGGYKLRVLMAQMLFGQPDLLLLDEPTNHLDIYSIKWLENYLLSYPGLLLVVSHDHHFLNAVCTKILDIDFGTIREYSGNYDSFVEAKALEHEQINRAIANQEKKKQDLQDFISRFRAKARHANMAQSRAKQLEKMEDISLQPSSRQYPAFSFSPHAQSGRTTLSVEGLSKSYGDKQVLKDLNFEIERGDRVAIIGPNGVGKSTLLKILMDKIEPNSGHFEWGHEALPGYFAQDYHDELTDDTTCYDWLYGYDATASIGQIRNLLGRMLFSGDDVYNKVTALSGGEATRLIFARLMLVKSNVLVLDEPTNHLDLEAIEMLTEALAEYTGTLLLVSHNRFLVRHVATRILELKPEGLLDFKGSYQEYLDKYDTDHLSRDVSLKERTVLSAQNQAKKADAPKLSGKAAYKAQKALRRKIQQLEKQIAQGEGDVPELQGQLQDAQAELEALN